jgi:hypothetical protein
MSKILEGIELSQKNTILESLVDSVIDSKTDQELNEMIEFIQENREILSVKFNPPLFK